MLGRVHYSKHPEVDLLTSQACVLWSSVFPTTAWAQCHSAGMTTRGRVPAVMGEFGSQDWRIFLGLRDTLKQLSVIHLRIPLYLSSAARARDSIDAGQDYIPVHSFACGV